MRITAGTSSLGERVLSYYQAVDAGDLGALLRLFHPEVSYRRGGYPPIVGRDALRHFYESVRIIDTGEHVIEALYCADQDVIARGWFTGSSRTGEDLEIGWSDFFHFDGDLIAERVSYFLTSGV